MHRTGNNRTSASTPPSSINVNPPTAIWCPPTGPVTPLPPNPQPRLVYGWRAAKEHETRTVELQAARLGLPAYGRRGEKVSSSMKGVARDEHVDPRVTEGVLPLPTYGLAHLYATIRAVCRWPLCAGSRRRTPARLAASRTSLVDVDRCVRAALLSVAGLPMAALSPTASAVPNGNITTTSRYPKELHGR
jgi:hypothetical protein